MKTTVVNVNRDKYDVYIGRANRWKKLKQSVFANPFPLHNEDERDSVIEEYRVWFNNQLETNPEFKPELEKLRGKRLACWCKPKACHGDVIIEYLDGES